MSALDDKTLQMLFDGELPADEAERLEATLEAHEGNQARLEGLDEMRGLLQHHLGQQVESADLDQIWRGVAARVEEEPRLGAWARLKVWLSESMGAHPWRWMALGAATAVLCVALTFVLVRATPTASRGGDVVVKPWTPPVIEKLDFKGRHPDISVKGKNLIIVLDPEAGEDDPSDPTNPTGSDPPEDI